MKSFTALTSFSTLGLALSLPHAEGVKKELSARATGGCGNSQFLTNQTQYRFAFENSGKDRSYYWHLPASYDSTKSYPVIVGFHGEGGNGQTFEADTKLSEDQYSGEKIMVYPNGIDGSWAGASFHADSSSTIAEDIQFTADVVADVKSLFCVDETKVYAAGFSNGGGFVGTLACDPVGSTLFNAYAASSGSFYTDVNGPTNNCAPNPSSLPLRIMEIHGTADTVVPFAGGQADGGPVPPISSWFHWWVERNGCTAGTGWSSGSSVLRSSYTCAGQLGGLQLYKISGLGNAWADTEPNYSQATVPQGPTVVRGSQVIVNFFDGVYNYLGLY